MADPPVRSRKIRLDQLLVERGLAPSRTRAQALVLAGRVWSGEIRLDKPGHRVPRDLEIRVEPGRAYVGRGGLKLAGAMEDLALEVAGRQALDVGASTGGFTAVLLERGAVRVIALDVGRGQLDWSLRNDPRVVVLEGVNARYLRPGQLPFTPDLCVVDVSFISLSLVLPPVIRCLAPGWDLVALIKPQFEVGRGQVGARGVVRDPRLHEEVLLRTLAWIRRDVGDVAALLPSPLRGAEGNLEYFVHVREHGRAPSGEDDPARVAKALRGLTEGQGS